MTNDKPTKKKIKKVVKVVQLIEETNPDIQIAISGLINREDYEVCDKVSSINRNLLQQQFFFF